MLVRYRLLQTDRGSAWIGGVAFVLVIVGLVVLLVKLIPSPNYAGTGNEFDITAVVTATTNDSVLVDHITVHQARGKADGWFTGSGGLFGANHQELHDNYNGSEFTGSRHYVGHVRDANGHEIDLKSLRAGQIAHVIGSIRASFAGKYHEDRAVYDLMKVIPQ